MALSANSLEITVIAESKELTKYLDFDGRRNVRHVRNGTLIFDELQRKFTSLAVSLSFQAEWTELLVLDFIEYFVESATV